MYKIEVTDFNNHQNKKFISVETKPTQSELIKLTKNKHNVKSKIINLFDENNMLYDESMFNEINDNKINLYFNTSNRISFKKFEDVSNVKDVYINIIANKSVVLDEAVKQLKNLKNLFSDLTHLIGMPDLHVGKYPIGSVSISKNTIYPELIGSDIGCGMALFKLSLSLDKSNDEKIKRISKKLYLENTLPNYGEQMKQKFIKHGLEICHEDTLGTIGHGNHFVEMQEIYNIYDHELANKYELEDDKYYLTVHSGSRDLGYNILNKYVNQEITLDEYMEHHNYAIKWAELNRQVIAEKFVNCINEVVTCNSTKILDLFHNFFECKDDMIIHRKGAVPAYDQPVIIPGSRGALTYVVQPINSSIENGFSVAHGAGRSKSRTNACECLKNKSIFDREKCMQPKNDDINNIVICENTDLLYEEAPFAYKDIDDVIDDLVEANLIKVIITLKPVITYKCRN